MSDIEHGPDEACPLCGGQDFERIISKGTGFILNGSGWYNKGGY
jgi:hypothetical protein